ncbi:hypothetical protein N7532_010615 [Penicillium argentinense]|uniref:Carboxylic ester hydrolase n=1 Tax=Penicillium argentinense TaxID=1131581 RepID=A0A9W9JXT9_9EURO|nr:uncharacterized protein N7532_010615 [Penicillium argentinense]KAJ5085844.1 hypothetical protein N7532_010615 [Penicillium argentinense]
MLKKICLAASLAAIAGAVVSPHMLDSDISILIHNDLQEKESPWAGSGILVLDAMSLQEANKSCESLGEAIWSVDAGYSAIEYNLDYISFQGKFLAGSSQRYWIAPVHGTPSTIDANGRVKKASPKEPLPVLCTQNAPYSSTSSQDTSPKWQVSVHSNNEQITGYRDRLSFRFLGIRYASLTKRWTYSKLYEGAGPNVSALNLGSTCLGASTGSSEDCFFLNVWTPYLPNPKKLSKKDLKPVMFWIHGGAFTGGSGGDSLFDGSNLASRGDVVVVTINYRLGTLGFLALDDGETNGNYGLADQITALEWVRRNIQDFGGDPDRITIFGQSAGAGSVRALLASPRARGKFASAIMQSNLGGLGYGTTYSKYYTIEEEMEAAGKNVLALTNCTDAESRVECLRAVPAKTVSDLDTTARYLVVDGKYLTSSELDLTNSAETANVPLMVGTTRDDGAALIGYPTAGETIQKFLNESGMPSIAPSSIFPVPSTSNRTLDIFNATARVATDGIFRCIDQVTAYDGFKNKIFPEIFYYEFNRTYQTPGWSPNSPVCEAPITPDYPHGDPNQEYFKCHSGDLYYVFGNLLRDGIPMRDELDLPFEQYVVDLWSSFSRTGRPTPDLGFLKARGYVNTTRQVEVAGQWKPFRHGEYRMHLLQSSSKMVDLGEREQCEALKLPLSYYSA